MFRWKDFSAKHKPMILLAPMEGYTDSAYRQLVKSVEPSVVCYTEFTSSDGLKYGSRRSFQKIDFKEDERPLIAQIFGKNPEHFGECAKMLEEMGVDGIDINMGCPSGKVINSCHGSALFKFPKLACDIVEATAKATKLDVSVKMRLGFSHLDINDLLPFTKGLENSGCKHLAIHGRTTKQKYTGLADFEPIYIIKEHLTIPVSGNGDIKSFADAQDKLKNLDGLMIGRATYGNPWVMKEIVEGFKGNTYNGPKTFLEKLPTIYNQLRLAVDFKGERVGILEMRKHLANYIKDFPGASKYRFELVRVNTEQEAVNILEEIKKSL